MSELSLLDDAPQATPLDLLINAISGSGQYSFSGDDATTHDEEGGDMATYLDNGKRAMDSDGSTRLKKIGRTLSSHFATPQQTWLSRAFSTVEVWHPNTGQKSYGKERRILQPPPTLRITGPLAPLVSNVTLSSLLNPDPPTGRVLFSAQTHRIAAPGEEQGVDAGPGGRSKKVEREDRRRRLREAAAKTGWGSTLPWERNSTAPRDREELADGLTFPGLWVGEDTGKSKEFRLELSIGQPGEEPRSEIATSQHLDDAALQHVLGGQIDPLMGLGEADQASGSATAKLVESLGVVDAIDPSLGEAAEAQGPQQVKQEPKPWATFLSEPLSIVSKPSQKTAKARSMASCLATDDAFALYVRVNAQTVRTKFMTLDGGDQPALCARTGKWSPFRFEVVQRATPPEPEDKGSRTRFKIDVEREKGIVTYGSVVQLVDVKSGSRSDPYRLVKVDKNEVYVGAEYGHPVSELQRVGLVRMVDGEDDMEGGGRWYLSAPGAVAGAGEVNVTRARPAKRNEPANEAPPAPPATLGSLDMEAGLATPPPDESVAPPLPPAPPARKKKTKRHALARAAITEEEQGSTAAGLVWHRAQRREGERTVTKDKATVTRPATIETVEDWMCWVLSGVSCFSYSFFNGLGDVEALPKASLDVVPRLLVPPNFRPDEHIVDLTLSTFFIPDDSGAPQPFSVYLGPIGPLHATTWRSAAPKEKYYEPGAPYDAHPYSGTMDEESVAQPDRRVLSNFPFSIPHVIASVDLPNVDEIVRIMQEYTPHDSDPEPAQAPEPVEAPSEDPAWLGVMGPATELTIQEAIQNAGKTHGTEHDLPAILQTPVEVDSLKDGFEIGQLGSSLIDPALTAEPEAPTDTPAPQPVTMHASHRAKESLSPLPLLLVRPDGVGHGVGWSVLAYRTDSEGAPWGLQVVQTSATGQALWEESA